MTLRSPFPEALSLVQVVDVDGARDGARIDEALGGGVTCVWLRDPSASGRSLYEAAGSLLLRCRRLDAALLVGDRVDVALAVNADGVQLGHRSVPAPSVRAWYRGWIGMSCHDQDELTAARHAGANHVVLSPVFGVASKGAPLGLDGLEALLRSTALPAVALGGIEAENVQSVRALPVAGVAVIRAIGNATDPAHAARLLSRPVTAS